MKQVPVIVIARQMNIHKWLLHKLLNKYRGYQGNGLFECFLSLFPMPV